MVVIYGEDEDLFVDKLCVFGVDVIEWLKWWIENMFVNEEIF